MTLHDTQELDNDLGGRTDEHLTLASALGIDNVVLRCKCQYQISCHATQNIQGNRSNIQVNKWDTPYNCYSDSPGQIRGPFCMTRRVGDGVVGWVDGLVVSTEYTQDECRATKSAIQTGCKKTTQNEAQSSLPSTQRKPIFT